MGQIVFTQELWHKRILSGCDGLRSESLVTTWDLTIFEKFYRAVKDCERLHGVKTNLVITLQVLRISKIYSI